MGRIGTIEPGQSNSPDYRLYQYRKVLETDHGPLDPEGSEVKRGGDEAAGKGRVPPPRTLGDWGYSNWRRKEEIRRGKSTIYRLG